jgi:hypothetical protein
VDEGLDYYGLETSIFPAIAKAEELPRLTKQHALLILKWKLGRIKESNNETVSDDNLRQLYRDGFMDKHSVSQSNVHGGRPEDVPSRCGRSPKAGRCHPGVARRGCDSVMVGFTVVTLSR